jgi:hypothetical protein
MIINHSLPEESQQSFIEMEKRLHENIRKMANHLQKKNPSEEAGSIAENISQQYFTSTANSVTLEQVFSTPLDPSQSIEITEDSHNRSPHSFTK